MSVLINFKICDNSKECGGIAVCPTGALSWDENKNEIKIDNNKCTSCGSCENECPVGAIKVAKTKKEYDTIKKDIGEDLRKQSDLFVDRYGAKPIHLGFLLSEENFEKEIVNSNRTVVLEVFNNESVMCLLRSITMRELLGDYDFNYKKVELKGDSILKKYDIKKLPSLLFFNNGKLIGKIEGYFDYEKKKQMENKIKNIVSKIK
jgi:Fe-S-cluster-containing hydrogenase component 2